jgi:transposase
LVNLGQEVLMGMLADMVDHVIGVDTHRDTHTAAIVQAGTGAAGVEREVRADASGYRQLLRFAIHNAPGRRAWAIESTGSYGAGLTAFLLEHGEWVLEVERPVRAARRNGAKSDPLDAVRAGREALAREHLAQPRQRGDREALRVLLLTRRKTIRARTREVNQLKSLIVCAPEQLRVQLRNLNTDRQVRRCATMRLPTAAGRSSEQRATVLVLRMSAKRIQQLTQEAEELRDEIVTLVKANVPELLNETGVGPISAAQLFCSWSHQERIRNESAFAMLSGAAPIPASSGQTVRYRLNKSGDRQLNCALHTIVLSRLQTDPETQAYAQRRLQEGKSPREVKRCLKRYLARRLYRILQDTGPRRTITRPPRARTLGICS